VESGVKRGRSTVDSVHSVLFSTTVGMNGGPFAEMEKKIAV
jgi:hypothetical protein